DKTTKVRRACGKLCCCCCCCCFSSPSSSSSSFFFFFFLFVFLLLFLLRLLLLLLHPTQQPRTPGNQRLGLVGGLRAQRAQCSHFKSVEAALAQHHPHLRGRLLVAELSKALCILECLEKLGLERALGILPIILLFFGLAALQQKLHFG